ncbi:hypothetical protein RI065_08205 [Mycoplasmatota bacterium zrk1]
MIYLKDDIGICESQSLFAGYYVNMLMYESMNTDTKRNDSPKKITGNYIDKALTFFDGKPGIKIIDFCGVSIQPTELFYSTLRSGTVIFMGIRKSIYIELQETIKEVNPLIDMIFFGDKVIISTDKLWSQFISSSGRFKVIGLDVNLSSSVDESIYNSLIELITQNIIGDFLYSMHKESKIKYLPSSNMYANRYIDIKSIMLDPTIFSLVIDKLCTLVREILLQYEGQVNAKKVILVGVSQNGGILATIIGNRMRLNYTLINKLGPDYSYSPIDTTFIKEEKGDYLLISDFLCLGSEYIRAKVLLESVNANVVGMVTVGQVENRFRYDDNEVSEMENRRIKSVTGNINKLTCCFNYKLSYMKEDLER